jgi:hypothetical protein
MAFTRYSDEWRLSRRIVQQTFRADSALKFRPMQIRRAREMIVNLIDDPQHYHVHFATLANFFVNVEQLSSCPQVLVLCYDVSSI